MDGIHHSILERDENSTELLSSNPAEDLAEDFGPVTHEWGSGDPAGMREVGGSQHLREKGRLNR